MRSVKGGGAHSSSMINPRSLTLHQHLTDAIRIGYRFDANNSKKWECTDIDIQRRVIQSLAPFLETLSGDEFKHPLIKDSLGDIVEALVWILHDERSITAKSAKVALKFVSFAPNSVLKPYLVDLVRPLSWLLSLNQIEVVKTCATALNSILINLSVKSEKVVWEILEKTNIIPRVICNIQNFSRDGKSVEHIKEMQSLLSNILWRWPPSRFPVWNDINLIKALKDFQMESGSSIKATILKLYSAIALCRSGAKKLIECGEVFLQMIVQCMDSSNSYPVRMEGFKLVRCLAMNEDGCIQMMDLCCEPIVNAIIGTMSECGLHAKTRTNEQMSLLLEACRLALITRWTGKHHHFFWKHGIEKLLLDLLMINCTKQLHHSDLSLEEKINIAREGLKAHHFPALRLYIWNILGWLATRCEADFYVNGSHIDLLITFACVAFLETIAHWHQICWNDKLEVSRRASNLLAVMMMVCSPCNYIASKAISVLSEILRPTGDEYLKDLIQSLSSTSSFGSPEMSKIRIAITLMGLTCFLHLPEYQTYTLEYGGTETLLDHLKWCLDNKYFAESLSFSPHLYEDFQEKTCCWEFEEDWEGKDILLFCTLVGLAELISHLSPTNNEDLYSKGSIFNEGDLASKLLEICMDSSSAGLKWYAAYILVYFDYYGFPSKLGKRIGRALNIEEFSDIKLILKDGMPQNVHGVILAVQSRSLLPLTFLCPDEKKSNSFSKGDDSCSTQVFQKEVRLSAHVDCEALLKLLEYVYFGFLQAGDDLVKKMRSLAKHCNMQPLLYMLRKKKPKWGTPFPCWNLTLALGQAGQEFSDLILEAEATEPTGWTCNFCSLSVPHMHVHKVILWSSCDYLRALLESGMRESHSGVIKVPVGWEGLVKLVEWIYAEKLPNPLSGCKWDNMSVKEKVHELQPYLELYRLAEFWILPDVGEACFNVIVSSLNSSTVLSVEVIRIAADYSLWKVAGVAATILAPSYRQLYNDGQLEALDNDLVNMIRAASVQF